MTDLMTLNRPGTAFEAAGPFDFLRREMDRLFDVAGNGGLLNPWSRNGAMLHMDVAETEKDIQVSAELPGVDLKDVDVTLANGVLCIKGEKRVERDEKKADFHIVERSVGTFERRISVPDGCDAAQIKAEFSNGLLKVTVSKPASAQSAAQKIKISKT